MLRRVENQVIVITGASSGIGRETGIRLGARGASVVLAARNEAALHEVARVVDQLGGRAHVVVTDVAEFIQVQRLANEAVDRFGRIDTWINNAGVSVYGSVEHVPVEEIERVIRVNLIGMIYGVKAVLPHLKRQRQGTIINVASVLGLRSVPLQAAYCSSKHGIKGFTDALRMELRRDRCGINVALILPSSMNTPIFNAARSRMRGKPKPLPPVYTPALTAEAIVFATEHPVRDLIIGDGGKLLDVAQRISPALVDRFMLLQDRMFSQQQVNERSDGVDNLFEPIMGVGSVTGAWGKAEISTSAYTRYVEPYPNRKRLLVALIAAGLVALTRRGAR